MIEAGQPGAVAVYAHSVPGAPQSDWEELGTHLSAVATQAAEFAAAFGCAELARHAGVLHDIGKCPTAFQDYVSGHGVRPPCAEQPSPTHIT